MGQGGRAGFAQSITPEKTKQALGPVTEGNTVTLSINPIKKQGSDVACRIIAALSHERLSPRRHTTASRSVQVRVLSAFALIAFALAAIGIHGLLSFSVSQRVHEIGVRVAPGAQSGDILSMVIRRSVMLAVAGVVPGIALAYAAARSLEALLAGVKPADTVTMASAIGLSVLMTVGGSLMPTLRALRIDPITALRSE
jgi:ABC-type antimicrobial peptide transport system permease subunit